MQQYRRRAGLFHSNAGQKGRHFRIHSGQLSAEKNSHFRTLDHLFLKILGMLVDAN